MKSTSITNSMVKYRFLSLMPLIVFFYLLPTQSLALDKIIWQAQYDYVALERNHNNKSSSDHPAKYSPNNIYSALKAIRYTEKKSSLLNFDELFGDEDEGAERFSERLFSDAELRKLSPAISKALNSANSNQDVVFSISSPRKGTLTTRRLTTTARLFVKEKKINLILGEVLVSIEKKYRRSGKTSDVSSKVDYSDLKNFKLPVGERNKPHKLPIKIVPTTGVSLIEKRQDWVVLDQEVIKSHSPDNTKQTNSNDLSQTKQEDFTPTQEHRELEQKVERLERQIEANKETHSDPAKSTDTSVEARLERLKQLYDKGYITEEIYNNKVSEILKDF